MKVITIVAAILLPASVVGCQMQPDKMQRVTFNCDTDAECAALPPCLLKQQAYEQGKSSAGCDGGPNTHPYRLVGYDCKGATVPLYRDEEDEFPQCKAIEAVWPGADW